jgi:hypothetical protein
VPPPEIKFKVCPEQGVLLDAVATGLVFTVTTVCAVAEHPPAAVTVTVYVPAAASVTLAIAGF